MPALPVPPPGTRCAASMRASCRATMRRSTLPTCSARKAQPARGSGHSSAAGGVSERANMEKTGHSRAAGGAAVSPEDHTCGDNQHHQHRGDQPSPAPSTGKPASPNRVAATHSRYPHEVHPGHVSRAWRSSMPRLMWSILEPEERCHGCRPSQRVCRSSTAVRRGSDPGR